MSYDIGGRVLGFRILWDCVRAGFPKTEWLPPVPSAWAFRWKFCLKFEGGVLGFRILWDRKGWAFKDQVTTLAFIRFRAVVLVLRTWTARPPFPHLFWGASFRVRNATLSAKLIIWTVLLLFSPDLPVCNCI